MDERTFLYWSVRGTNRTPVSEMRRTIRTSSAGVPLNVRKKKNCLKCRLETIYVGGKCFIQSCESRKTQFLLDSGVISFFFRFIRHFCEL